MSSKLRPSARPSNRRAFTLIELAVGLVGTSAGLAVLAITLAPAQPAATQPAVNAGTSARDHARTLKDQTQVRGLTQAMIVWSANNNGQYPLPSAVDLKNTTINAAPASKDTTAHLFSLLVFNGFVPTEMLIAPTETNPNVKAMTTYAFTQPSKAASPALALWDPSLAADFTDGNTGNISYAHQTLTPARRALWNSSIGAFPVVGNRGPRTTALIDLDENPASSLPITDPKRVWKGNIGLGDGSVAVMTSTLAPGVTYSDNAGVNRGDHLFFDEQDNPSRTNVYFTITTHAGSREPNFRAIWD